MTKPIPAPTQADILAAIRDAVGTTRHDPGISAREYAVAEGMGFDAARRRLDAGVGKGLLLKGYAPREQANGRFVRTPVYRPV